jgi:CRP/FNR family cyclic AMP-dependent transcriptional regulator
LPHTKRFRRGEPLCHIGDKSHEIFILIKGQLLVSSPAGKEITRIDPIGTIGEMGIFTDELRSANVCAAMESITIIIRKTEFIILLRRDNDLAIHILMNVIKDLSEKLRKDNKIIEDLKESDHTVKEPDHTLQQTPHSGQCSDNTGEQG